MKIARQLPHAIVLVLASTIIALLVCEVAARVLFAPIRGAHWYYYDARYVMRHRSGIDQWTSEWGDGGLWHFRTNSHGFRGEEWTDTPAPGTQRVLVLGDSFTFGNGVSEGEAFPQVADHLVRAGDDADRRWEVLNLGVSAWGPQNALAYLETEGASIGGACLVYAFYLGNDVMDNVHYHLYSLRDGALERNPVGDEPHSWGARVREGMRAIPAYDALLVHSQLFNLVRRTFLARTEDHESYERTYVTPSADVYAQALDLNDATLTRMQTLAKQRFRAFALVLLPPRPELDGSSDPHINVHLADEARERVRRWASGNDLHVLDFVELLPHDSATVQALYFQRDFHMTAAGNRLVGEIFAQHLPWLCEEPSVHK